MKVSWKQPYNGGSNITAYQVQILQIDGTTFRPELSFCDASSASAMSTLSCLVPVFKLRSLPFGLDWGMSVSAQV